MGAQQDDRLGDLSVAALTEAIAARTPTPGGGVAAAVAAAHGAALLSMVSGFSVSAAAQADSAVQEALLAHARRGAHEFLAVAEADAQAYAAVSAALARRKDDPQRAAAIAAACRRACEPPAQLAEHASELLVAAANFAPFVNRNLACDLAIAADLLLAACRAGELLVRVNAQIAGEAAAPALRQAADNLTCAQEAHTAILGTLQLRE
ncbi:MAG: formimidoyltetrahydrofolate cyclodeaminase [Planctomycetota bacterium]|nr:MAG: formimidoyltetrahydrofolate cyclodeaminase [Planctomycetota bacterium]